MDKFASQLANLQRVASRAGGNDEDRRRDDGQRRDVQRDAHHDGHRDRQRDGRGSYDRRDGYSDRRYDDRRHDGRGGYDRDRRYDDRRDGYDRKRRRDEDHYQRRNDRRPGRGYGGRHNDRYDARREEKEPQVPLADLVKSVAGKYCKSVESGGSNDVGKRRHIALLFLTIDDLPHEHIWKEWIKGPSSDAKSDGSNEGPMISVICHAKYPERITSPWLKQRHLIRFQKGTDEKQESDSQQQHPPKLHSRRPEWGSIEITRGMIDLLEEGLRIGGKKETGDVKSGDANIFDRHTSYRRYVSSPSDALPESDDANASPIQSDDDIPPVDRFIFLSESCLPVTTLNEVEMALFGPKTDKSSKNTDDGTAQKKNPYNKSWINARSTPNNGYSRQLQWDEIRKSDIPSDLVWKADQWIVLNRAHGEAVASMSNNYLNGRSLWYAFRRCRASDEMYFPTALSILGIIARPPGVVEVEDERNEKCAGDQIRRRKVTYCDWSVSAKNPASFTAKDLEKVVVKARGEGCLFARKFVPLVSNSQAKDAHAVSNDGIVTVENWLDVMQKLR